jgi:polyhydroxyalkanoate synthesis regulator phasin
MKGYDRMKNQKPITKLLSGLLVGGLLMGTGVIALAGTNDTGASSQANGTPPIHGPKMPGRQQANPELMQSIINGLVSDGTLTQTQGDAIIAKITQLDTNRKAEMEKIKAMTQSERDAFRQDNKTEKTQKTNPLAALVTAGTLTQAQADAISQTLGKGHGQKGPIENGTKMSPEDRQAQLTAKLSSLVEKGTITSDQSATILEKIAQEDTARKAEMEKTKDMTQAERKTYLQENKTNKNNTLAELVTAGTLTQAQADEVSKVFGNRNGQKGSNE